MSVVNLDWEKFQRKYNLDYNDFDFSVSEYVSLRDLEMKSFEVFVYFKLFLKDGLGNNNVDDIELMELLNIYW